MLALGFFASGAISATAQVKPAIPLPIDPSTVVITMDWQGTYRVGRMLSAPPIPPGPVLSIRADGTATAIARADEPPREIRGVLPPDEIQQLLHFAVDEKEFFAINGADIQKAIADEQKRMGRGFTVSDSSNTIIHIETADKANDVKFYALDVYAKHYPAIKALQQLRTVEIKLEHIYLELMAGGKAEVARSLDRANAYMKQQDSAFSPLSADDLFTVQTVNGNKTTQFYRDQKNGKSLSVTVVETPNVPPIIKSQLRTNF